MTTRWWAAPRLFSSASLGLVVACSAVPTSASAINIVLDYSRDTQDFFGSGNPDGAASGAQAKATMEFAADFFSTLLEDTFSSIQTPPTFYSTAFDGEATWQWTNNFTHPGTGSTWTDTNSTIAADEYRVYVGGRSLGGSTLGQGGPGGFSWSSSPSGGFTNAEINELNTITADFSAAVVDRGTTDGGFSAWGGGVTFDNDGSTNWHYDHVTAPSSGESDFLSVAFHELGHALGLGTSSEWNALLSGGYFTGTDAVAAFGGLIPAGSGHFDEDVMSVIFGTSIAQEVAMDPNLTSGTRKVFTEVDVAALSDIGWTTGAPAVAILLGDFNSDGFVAQGDLDLILLNWGSTVAPAGFDEGALASGGPFDGLVSQNELDDVLLNWGLGTPLATAIPEPTTGVVLLGLAVGLVRRRAGVR